MRKDEMLTKIQAMMNEMLPLLQKAKCKYIVEPLDDHIKLTSPTLKDSLKWLKEIYTGTYKEARDVYAFVSPDRWAMYEKWDLRDLKEVILLQSKLVKLKKAWSSSKRPDYFKKSKLTKLLGDKK